MKILIITQALRTNYGGLLQAYALQKVLKDLGHDVVTDKKNYKAPKLSIQVSYSLYRIIRGGVLRTEKFRPVLPRMLNNSRYLVISQNTERFINQNINTTNFFNRNNKPFRKEIHKYDAFVVGSDQVWRKKYSDLRTHFLSFLKNSNVKRIAYSASFGSDNISDYSKREVSNCTKLASRFDGISVREDTGIEICKNYFNVDAEHLLDPTLLLEKEDYSELIEPEDKLEESNILMCYVLDKSIEKKSIINHVSSELSLDILEVMPKESYNNNRLQNLENCIYPPVSKWLAGFRDASFVVTDSFHGTVFSIIFNKPFIAIGNKTRGLTRFTSLLKIFSLEDRLIERVEELNDNSYDKIDYHQVNIVKAEWQKKSMDFLTGKLK